MRAPFFLRGVWRAGSGGGVTAAWAGLLQPLLSRLCHADRVSSSNGGAVRHRNLAVCCGLRQQIPNLMHQKTGQTGTTVKRGKPAVNTKNNHNSLPGPRVRCGVHAGNEASDLCYFERNWANLDPNCLFYGRCYNHYKLKLCLSTSGEPYWWHHGFKDVPNQHEACVITKDAIKDWKPSDQTEMINIMGCA